MHNFFTRKPLPTTLLLLYPVAFSLVLFFFNRAIGFQQLHNDFWDCYFIARHLTFADLKTLFNPQYPIGYCSFLRLIMGHGDPAMPAIVANLFFGAVILYAAARLYRSFLSPWTVLVSVVFLSLYPRLFTYINVGGGDPGSVAFFTLGAALILHEIHRRHGGASARSPWMLLGGFCLGMGALFRYHVFVGGVLLLFALFIAYRRTWRLLFVAGIGLCLTYSSQWTINCITGHRLFETQFGPMNVYDLMYKLSWYQTTSLAMPHSVVAVISLDPLLFIRKYLLYFLSFAPAYAPAVIAWAVVKEKERRRLCLAVAVWEIIYFALFSATTSSRQVLLALPLTFLTFGILLEEISSRTKNVRTPALWRVAGFGIAGLLLTFFVWKDYQKFALRSSEKNITASVESDLHSMSCTSVKQIFSTDFDIYFKTFPPFIPFFNGGAPRWGTYLYNKEYPELPVGTIDSFANACRARGIRFVLLTPPCSLLSKPLGELYNKETSGDFILRDRVGRFKIFETGMNRR